MRIGVVGVGGIGGYFGGRLAAAGLDVTFVARGRHAAALREKGLRILSPDGDAFVEHPQVVERPEDLGPQDAVLDCVKLWDLEDTGRALAASKIGKALVVPFQNGVEAAAILRRHLPEWQVAQGIAYIPAEIVEPGVIRHNGGFAHLVVGALRPEQEAPLQALAEACRAHNVDMKVSQHVERDLWMKFLLLQALAGATASRRQSVGMLRDTAEGRALLQGLVAEAAAVARALDVALPDDAEARTWNTVESLPTAMRASMAIDLERGNRLELAWLNGTVERLSEERGLAAPHTRAVMTALAPHSEGPRT